MKREQKKKKSNLLLLLAPLLLFAAGAGIFLYPAVSNYLAERQQSEVIHTYRAAVNEMDQAEIDAAWQEAVEYNENLAGDPVHDPFVMGSGYVLPDNYEEVLNVNGDGVMGYIDIPKIDVYLPIYHGTSERNFLPDRHLRRRSFRRPDLSRAAGDPRHAVLHRHMF